MRGPLATLMAAGLSASMDRGQLRVAPASRLTGELRAFVRDNRAEIEADLTPSPVVLALIGAATEGLRIAADRLAGELAEGGDLSDVASGAIDAAALRLVAETLDVMHGRDAVRKRTRRKVRCADCIQYRRSPHHPHLGRCAAGQPGGGAGGLWDTDARTCEGSQHGGD
jgi:hypothetical protein